MFCKLWNDLFDKLKSYKGLKSIFKLHKVSREKGYTRFLEGKTKDVLFELLLVVNKFLSKLLQKEGIEFTHNSSILNAKPVLSQDVNSKTLPSFQNTDSLKEIFKNIQKKFSDHELDQVNSQSSIKFKYNNIIANYKDNFVNPNSHSPHMKLNSNYSQNSLIFASMPKTFDKKNELYRINTYLNNEDLKLQRISSTPAKPNETFKKKLKNDKATSTMNYIKKNYRVRSLDNERFQIIVNKSPKIKEFLKDRNDFLLEESSKNLQKPNI